MKFEARILWIHYPPENPDIAEVTILIEPNRPFVWEVPYVQAQKLDLGDTYTLDIEKKGE